MSSTKEVFTGVVAAVLLAREYRLWAKLPSWVGLQPQVVDEHPAQRKKRLESEKKETDLRRKQQLEEAASQKEKDVASSLAGGAAPIVVDSSPPVTESSASSQLLPPQLPGQSENRNASQTGRTVNDSVLTDVTNATTSSNCTTTSSKEIWPAYASSNLSTADSPLVLQAPTLWEQREGEATSEGRTGELGEGEKGDDFGGRSGVSLSEVPTAPVFGTRKPSRSKAPISAATPQTGSTVTSSPASRSNSNSVLLGGLTPPRRWSNGPNGAPALPLAPLGGPATPGTGTSTSTSSGSAPTPLLANQSLVGNPSLILSNTSSLVDPNSMTDSLLSASSFSHMATSPPVVGATGTPNSPVSMSNSPGREIHLPPAPPTFALGQVQVPQQVANLGQQQSQSSGLVPSPPPRVTLSPTAAINSPSSAVLVDPSSITLPRSTSNSTFSASTSTAGATGASSKLSPLAPGASTTTSLSTKTATTLEGGGAGCSSSTANASPHPTAFPAIDPNRMFVSLEGHTKLNPTHIVPKLVVFDVDHTLIHTPLSRLQPTQMGSREKLEMYYDPDMLLQFCQICLAQHHQLRIATHAESSATVGNATWDEIATLLDGPLPYSRTYLCDPAHIACWRSKSGKNTHIEKIIESTEISFEGTFHSFQVVLIDDDFGNVKKAKAAGYLAFHVDHRGFCREWLLEQPFLCHLLGVQFNRIASSSAQRRANGGGGASASLTSLPAGSETARILGYPASKPYASVTSASSVGSGSDMGSLTPLQSPGTLRTTPPSMLQAPPQLPVDFLLSTAAARAKHSVGSASASVSVSCGAAGTNISLSGTSPKKKGSDLASAGEISSVATGSGSTSTITTAGTTGSTTLTQVTDPREGSPSPSLPSDSTGPGVYSPTSTGAPGTASLISMVGSNPAGRFAAGGSAESGGAGSPMPESDAAAIAPKHKMVG